MQVQQPSLPLIITRTHARPPRQREQVGDRQLPILTHAIFDQFRALRESQRGNSLLRVEDVRRARDEQRRLGVAAQRILENEGQL